MGEKNEQIAKIFIHTLISKKHETLKLNDSKFEK